MEKEILMWKLHKRLLELLGYNLDIEYGDTSKREIINIFKCGSHVGSILCLDKNLFWLNKENQNVYNRDLTKVRFSKDKSKNIDTCYHTCIHDFDNFYIECYNIATGSTNIGLSNDFIDISLGMKHVQDVTATSVNYEQINDNAYIDFVNPEMQSVLSIKYKTSEKIKSDNYSFEEASMFNDIVNQVQGKDLIKNVINNYKKEQGKVLKFTK